MKQKATDLKLGAIYINATTGEPNRLTHIVPCEGAWLETYDGQGYGETISFDSVQYADLDEVRDYLEDAETYNNGVQLPPVPKVIYIPNV